ncbi:MAG TPA: hypothetical protein VGP70_22920 [Actinomadura sp.]|jgi:hypothetical protein|nr:hypothetical protein [Actinomadura sp.]
MAAMTQVNAGAETGAIGSGLSGEVLSVGIPKHMTAVLSGLFLSATTVLAGAPAMAAPARAEVAAVAPHHVAVGTPGHWNDCWDECGHWSRYDEWEVYDEWDEWH